MSKSTIDLEIKTKYSGEGFKKADLGIREFSKKAKTATDSVSKVTSALGTLEGKAGSVASKIGGLFSAFARGGVIGIAIAGITTAFSFVVDQINKVKERAKEAAEKSREEFVKAFKDVGVKLKIEFEQRQADNALKQTMDKLLSNKMMIETEKKYTKEITDEKIAGIKRRRNMSADEAKVDELKEKLRLNKIESEKEENLGAQKQVQANKSSNEANIELQKRQEEYDEYKRKQAAKLKSAETEMEKSKRLLDVKQAAWRVAWGPNIIDKFILASSDDNSYIRERNDKEKLQAEKVIDSLGNYEKENYRSTGSGVTSGALTLGTLVGTKFAEKRIKKTNFGIKRKKDTDIERVRDLFGKIASNVDKGSLFDKVIYQPYLKLNQERISKISRRIGRELTPLEINKIEKSSYERISKRFAKYLAIDKNFRELLDKIVDYDSLLGNPLLIAAATADKEKILESLYKNKNKKEELKKEEQLAARNEVNKKDALKYLPEEDTLRNSVLKKTKKENLKLTIPVKYEVDKKSVPEDLKKKSTIPVEYKLDKNTKPNEQLKKQEIPVDYSVNKKSVPSDLDKKQTIPVKYEVDKNTLPSTLLAKQDIPVEYKLDKRTKPELELAKQDIPVEYKVNNRSIPSDLEKKQEIPVNYKVNKNSVPELQLAKQEIPVDYKVNKKTLPEDKLAKQAIAVDYELNKKSVPEDLNKKSTIPVKYEVDKKTLPEDQLKKQDIEVDYKVNKKTTPEDLKKKSTIPVEYQLDKKSVPELQLKKQDIEVGYKLNKNTKPEEQLKKQEIPVDYSVNKNTLPSDLEKRQTIPVDYELNKKSIPEEKLAKKEIPVDYKLNKNTKPEEQLKKQEIPVGYKLDNGSIPSDLDKKSTIPVKYEVDKNTVPNEDLKKSSTIPVDYKLNKNSVPEDLEKKSTIPVEYQLDKNTVPQQKFDKQEIPIDFDVIDEEDILKTTEEIHKLVLEYEKLLGASEKQEKRRSVLDIVDNDDDFKPKNFLLRKIENSEGGKRWLTAVGAVADMPSEGDLKKKYEDDTKTYTDLKDNYDTTGLELRRNIEQQLQRYLEQKDAATKLEGERNKQMQRFKIEEAQLQAQLAEAQEQVAKNMREYAKQFEKYDDENAKIKDKLAQESYEIDLHYNDLAKKEAAEKEAQLKSQYAKAVAEREQVELEDLITQLDKKIVDNKKKQAEMKDFFRNGGTLGDWLKPNHGDDDKTQGDYNVDKQGRNLANKVKNVGKLILNDPNDPNSGYKKSANKANIKQYEKMKEELEAFKYDSLTDENLLAQYRNDMKLSVSDLANSLSEIRDALKNGGVAL